MGLWVELHSMSTFFVLTHMAALVSVSADWPDPARLLDQGADLLSDNISSMDIASEGETAVAAAQPNNPIGNRFLQRRVVNDEQDGAAEHPKVAKGLVAMPFETKIVALVRSFFAGLSTSLGAGVVAFLGKNPSRDQMAFSLALAGGVMVSVSVVELCGPKLLQPGWRWQAVFYTTIGALCFVGLSRLVPEPELASRGKGHGGDEEDLEGQPLEQRRGRQWRLAMLMMLALTAHNFPEGLAVAVSSLESERLGVVVMIAIAVHNIPEGIAIAMPVLDATGSQTRALQMATLSGLAEPFGAFFALTLLPAGWVEERGMDALLCIVGGIMTSVAVVELLPEARAQQAPKGACLGFLAGVLVMLFTFELV